MLIILLINTLLHSYLLILCHTKKGILHLSKEKKFVLEQRIYEDDAGKRYLGLG